jgi:hypothetical protein
LPRFVCWDCLGRWDYLGQCDLHKGCGGQCVLAGMVPLESFEAFATRLVYRQSSPCGSLRRRFGRFSRYMA